MRTLAFQFIFSIRFFISIVSLWGLAIQYSQRITPKVLMDCMINQTALEVHTNWLDHVHDTSLMFNRSKISFKNLSSDVCGYKNHVINRSHLDGPFQWTKSDQRLILSSYAIGYTLSQIPGAYFSLVLGAKRLIVIAYVFSSILTILTPFFAHLNKFVLVFCRFFVGFFHGGIWPTLAGLWVSWVPMCERGRLIGMAYAGSQIGNAITLPMGPVLCKNGFYGSWPIIFYFIGSSGLVWLLIWMLFSSDSPEENRHIKYSEKVYLLTEIPDQFSRYERLCIPWTSILTSIPCLALFAGHTCSKLGSYLLIESLPLYIREVLELDEFSDGALFAMPYVFFWFFTVCSGFVSDKIIMLRLMTRTNMRKVCHLLSFFVPMIATTCLVFVKCSSKSLGVSLITVTLAFTGCAYGGGLFIAYNDISGPFASITFAIGNTFGSMSGILAPFVVDFMHKNKKQEEWYVEYIVIAAMYLIGGLVLIMYSSASRQTWAVKRPLKSNRIAAAAEK